jgi:pyruvate,orthophosphate dikinase
MSSMADFYAILHGAALPKGGAADVGNKAWNLMRLVQANMPVPAAFVLPTTWCRRLPAESAESAESAAAIKQALAAGVELLEAATGLQLGSTRRPLLVSVRSGAAVSMPGMMETVLDVGLNDATVDAVIRMTGNPRLAWDCYRRLIQGYADVVASLPMAPFDRLVDEELQRAGVDTERELDHRSLRTLTLAMLDCYRLTAGGAFPADPYEQLGAATAAVFRSWDAPKAASYRHLNDISDASGTAVTIQRMVFGNAGGMSGTGVGFTRNPATGAREFYFDFKFNAQGEDVVGGRQLLSDNERLPKVLPAIWGQLNSLSRELETLFRDVQDFEFTVEEGKLYLLQTRNAKRTAWAAVAVAVDMVAEGLLEPPEALVRLKDIRLDAVARAMLEPPLPPPLAVAQVASLGVASGAIALDSQAASRLSAGGAAVILVRRHTVTSDVQGMSLAEGILTGAGGRTSHAAVIARQLGKVCLVGCSSLEVDLDQRLCRIGGTQLKEGAFLSLDGNTGAVYPGRLVTLVERPVAALATIATWVKHKVPA